MKLKYKKVVCRVVLTGRGVNIFMHKWRPRYFPKDTPVFGVRKSSSDSGLLLWSAAHSYSVRSDKCYKSQKCGIFPSFVVCFVCFINLKLFSRDLKLKQEQQYSSTGARVKFLLLKSLLIQQLSKEALVTQSELNPYKCHMFA